MALECYRNSGELPNSDVYKAERNAVQIPKAKRSSLGIPCLQIVYLFRMLGRKKPSLIEYMALCLSTDCSVLHMLQVLE